MTSTKRTQNHRASGQGVTCRYHGHSGCKICAQLPKSRP